MRYSLILLFSVVLLSFSACDGDDDDVAISSGLIVGEWQAVSGVQVGSTTTTGGGANTTAEFTAILQNPEKYFLRFGEGPDNRLTSRGDVNLEVIYTIDGMPFPSPLQLPVPIQEGNYSINGNTLIMNASSGQPQEATLTTLNDTELVVEGRFDQVTSQGGFATDQKSTYTYRFKRN